MARILVCHLCLLILFVVAGCGAKEQTIGKQMEAEPDYVTVQHVLIAFDGSVPDKKITRSQDEARRLAEDLFARAKSGEDFDMLVEEYTDDSFPGVYQLANHKAKPDKIKLIFARSQMVSAFGDVAFSLGVGEVGIARYDENRSKYGWHVILRLE
ncbi:MAG: peptidyl-prolyl cis-trans isomerase [Candidatus Krumholzibacteria bacterium]|nr:peptidyl-prolyl cis-trans isomerase [Candidatus Krumholzibacteria bacterium]